MNTWATHYLVREAAKLCAGSWGRSCFLVLFIWSTSASAAIFVSQDVENIARRDLTQLQKGALIRVVEPSAGSNIGPDAAACERLNSHEGVLAAGSVLAAQLVSLEQFPGMRVSHYRITRGYLSVAFFDYASGSNETFQTAAAGALAAESHGFAAGSAVSLTGHGVITIEKTLEKSSRVDDLSRSIVEISVPVGTAQKCIVEIDPRAVSVLGDTSLLALEDFGSDQLQVSSFTPTTAYGPSEQYAGRIAKHFGWIGAIAITIVLEILRFARRSETGLYRALGTKRVQLAVIHTTEYLLLASVAVALACSTLAVVATTRGWSSNSITHGCVTLVVTVSVPVLATVCVMAVEVRQNTAEALKDR